MSYFQLLQIEVNLNSFFYNLHNQNIGQRKMYFLKVHSYEFEELLKHVPMLALHRIRSKVLRGDQSRIVLNQLRVSVILSNRNFSGLSGRARKTSRCFPSSDEKPRGIAMPSFAFSIYVNVVPSPALR